MIKLASIEVRVGLTLRLTFTDGRANVFGVPPARLLD